MGPQLLFFLLLRLAQGQMLTGGAQVKITETPFGVTSAQQINKIVWTMLGTTTKDSIYCVSEAPVSQLRFKCTDCLEKNITDINSVLDFAQDLTQNAGFPTIQLKNVAVNVNWTGATIVCQATLNGGRIDSAPATIDVRYLRTPHVVDASGQGPIIVGHQGYRFYVECISGADGLCQPSGRRKTLRCAVQSHPPATQYRWLKNGVPTSGNGAEITIGTEMIGQSIQCQANNGLYADSEMPTSQAIQIDPYSAARLVQDNFNVLQSSAPFQSGNRIEMNQQINLLCIVEGNPRPIVFWKLRKPNGQVVDAACPQGYDQQETELTMDQRSGTAPNIARLSVLCPLRVANYSFTGQYWCSACSHVSQGSPECSPSLESPGSNFLNIQVTGPPMQSDAQPSIEQIREIDVPGSNNAIITVHYCAEPAPRPPREVIFNVDANDLQSGQSWENFRFESIAQNNTVPGCYMARLQISPVREADQNRQIYLRLQNQYGSTQIPVSLGSLLGDGMASKSALSAWWIVFFLFLASVIFLACCVTLCMKREILCFRKMKDSAEDYNEPKAKANLNVRENIYDVDSPGMYPPQGMENASSSGSYHEGVNFAEMTLVNRGGGIPLSSQKPLARAPPPPPMLWRAASVAGSSHSSSVQSDV